MLQMLKNIYNNWKNKEWLNVQLLVCCVDMCMNICVWMFLMWSHIGVGFKLKMGHYPIFVVMICTKVVLHSLGIILNIGIVYK